jgi:hypothetical protein
MIGIQDIQTAMGRIRDAIRVSPCTYSEAFSALTNNTIFLKLDNQQRTGAFKERGALNKLLTLTPDERGAGSNRRIRGKPCAGRGLSCWPARNPGMYLHAIAYSTHKSFGHARVWGGGGSAWHELR